MRGNNPCNPISGASIASSLQFRKPAADTIIFLRARPRSKTRSPNCEQSVVVIVIDEEAGAAGLAGFRVASMGQVITATSLSGPPAAAMTRAPSAVARSGSDRFRLAHARRVHFPVYQREGTGDA
jgi:hypothetical protein